MTKIFYEIDLLLHYIITFIFSFDDVLYVIFVFIFFTFLKGSSGNSLQLKHIPGSGYTPDADSQMLLQDIDEKLKNLLPSDDFMDICSTPSMVFVLYVYLSQNN